MKLSTINISEIEKTHTASLKATIYIPTSPQSTAQDQTRLKNALQIIRNNPIYDDRELGATLEKIYTGLIDNRDFWNYQDYGLAVLFDKDGYEFFHLPFEVTEAEYLTDHFVISPLAVIASADTGYYVLDVNLTQPRLFVGARGMLQQVEVANMPKDLESVIGRSAFKNHNLGFEDNAVNEDEKRYLSLIAAAAEEAIDYDERALLLAGTSNRIGNIRQLLNHGHVLETALVGSYEKADTEQIYQDSHQVVHQALRQERDDIVAKLEDTNPESVERGIDAIEAAANEGRVASVILPAYRVTNDTVQQRDAGERVVLDIPEDIESIESMIGAVILQGGHVISVQSDTYDSVDGPVAILRF